MLGQMASSDHLCVSFKLETDVDKLKERMAFALGKYKVDMVIGNCLLEKHWITIGYNPDTLGQR
jgi:hypothetical protein